MHGERTRGWWLTRIELATGIGVLMLTAYLGWRAVTDMCFGCIETLTLGPFEMRSETLVPIALVIALVGLAWMIRIFRGPRDEPPRWRYRDR
jgi:hypothetical protein